MEVIGQLHTVSFTNGECNPITHWKEDPLGPTAGPHSAESRKTPATVRSWTLINHPLVNYDTKPTNSFGGLEVACWPLVPKFAGSNPAKAVRFFRAKKILSAPCFGGEVKLSVPCRSFTACKGSLQWRGSRHCRQKLPVISHPQFHLSLLGSLTSLWTWRHLAVKVGMSKERAQKTRYLRPRCIGAAGPRTHI
jgi:hypothetical protein